MRQVDADLVRAAGLELGFEQRERRIGVGPDVAAPEDRARELAVRSLDAHAALAVAGRRTCVSGRSTARFASRHLPRTSTR